MVDKGGIVTFSWLHQWRSRPLALMRSAVQPMLDASPEGGIMPAGTYVVQILAMEGCVSPRLYIDTGDGLPREAGVCTARANGHSLLYLLDLPTPVRALMFHPGAQPVAPCGAALVVRRCLRVEHRLRLTVALLRQRAGGLAGVMHLLRRGFASLRKGGPGQLFIDMRDYAARADDARDYARWVELYDTPQPDMLAQLRTEAANLSPRPLVSVLMPVYNTAAEQLQDAINSVLAQTYDNWELCIADDASSAAHVRPQLEAIAARDARIRLVWRPQNGHISAASNSALEIAGGAWAVLLDHDDFLAPDALHCVVQAVNQHPDAALIYSDEDKMDLAGRRSTPYFKPDWNAELFRTHNFICHMVAYRVDRLRQIGGFRISFEGAQDYDLALRYIEGLAPQRIVHIPRVLYHWRLHEGSTALHLDAKDYATDAAYRALVDHFARTGVDAALEPAPAMAGMHRVRYRLGRLPQVSIIIPTRNGLSVLKTALESLFCHTDYPHFDIIIVDNGSDDPRMLTYLADLPDIAPVPVQVLRIDAPFNFAQLNNQAAAVAGGEFLLLLNNDIEVIEAGWLREMVGHAMQPGTGCVGARLLYQDRTLQHAGVVLGIGGVAGHAHKHLPADQPGYFGRAVLPREVSAVTAACMLVSRQIYLDAGGLDEGLKVAFNDVDFCMRLQMRGYRNIWTPYATLLHHESRTRGAETSRAQWQRYSAEAAMMHARWGADLQNDPAYNPNLTLELEDYSLAFPPRTGRQ